MAENDDCPDCGHPTTVIPKIDSDTKREKMNHGKYVIIVYGD